MIGLYPIAHSPEGARRAATEHVARGGHEAQESQGLAQSRTADEKRAQTRPSSLLPPLGALLRLAFPHISNFWNWRCILKGVSIECTWSRAWCIVRVQ